MPVLQDPKHEANGEWHDESLTLPKMDVMAPNHFAGPVGFIDFRFKHMKAENGRNATERRCQIRTVRLK